MYTACGKSLLLPYYTNSQIKISEQFLYVVRTHHYLSFLALNLLGFVCHGFHIMKCTAAQQMGSKVKYHKASLLRHTFLIGFVMAVLGITSIYSYFSALIEKFNALNVSKSCSKFQPA